RASVLLFSPLQHPRTPTLFPYTTLFRSGACGLTLLPYLDGERTPNLPAARGLLAGLTRANATPANLARAAVEGMLCGLADGLDRSEEHTSELQSLRHLVCRLLLEKKKLP